ncbi:MAG: hypothetical protein KAX19_01285 [Candidatus Brocadiae bacterium]|nr:hypothetical protein [Candidatus Brocadiia bacterium]
MVEEIGVPGHDRSGPLSRSDRARIHDSKNAAEASRSGRTPEVVVSSELRELIERVKEAEGFRKDRVHEVLEKLRRGELVTSETVREAAERILRDGI